MPLAPLFLLTLALGMPLYATLHAASLILPAYSICLGLAGLLLWCSLRNRNQWLTDDMVLFVMLLGGISLAIGGFALAPLLVQILMVAALLCLQRKYVGSISNSSP